MVKKTLFDQVGLFDESLHCCEDYDFWLRVSSGFPFYLVDLPLTVKEGGREDQVSFKCRVGMDRLRIYAIKKIIDSETLDSRQRLLALDEVIRKCTLFGKGCLKHGRIETGTHYLKLAESFKDKLAEGPWEPRLAVDL